MYVNVALLHGHGGGPRSMDTTGVKAVVSDARCVVGTLVEPRGPVALSGLDASSVGFAWWPDGDGEFSHAVWDGLCAYLDDAVHVGWVSWGEGALVAGFSQGAAAAIAWVLHPKRRTRLDLVVLCAGFLPDGFESLWRERGEPVSASPPLVVMVHPEDDEVVDSFYGHRAATFLRSCGMTVLYEEIPGNHHWPTDLFATLQAHVNPIGWVAVKEALRGQRAVV